MKLTLEEQIAHGGHKVLRWMMDNVYVRQDPAGNIKMDKEKSTEKIDAAVATAMALDRAIRNQGSEESVYDGRGIILEFVEIQTVGHLLMFRFCRGNRDIVVEISDSKKNSHMEFQTFPILHISDTGIKLCQVNYVFFIDNVPIHRAS